MNVGVEDSYFQEFVRIISVNWNVALFGILIILLYIHYTSTFDFFREKGVAFDKPYLIVGNIGERVLMRISFHDFVLKLYKKFDGLPYAGMFEGRRPVLMLRDPKLIKQVMVRDFDHFTDRNTLNQGGKHYVDRMLLTLKGQEWKSVRSILTPTFSTSKLKAMSPLVSSCAEQMVKMLRNRKDGEYEMEAKSFMGRYTLDIIGSCAFGIECDSLKDSNAHFVSIAQKFDYMPLPKRLCLFIGLLLAPGLIKYFPIRFLNTSATDKLVEILRNTKKQREISAEYRRNDFYQLLLDAAKKEREESNNDPQMKISLDDATIDAQLILFLIAGFETSSTVLSFVSYILAKHPEIQEKLRDEVKSITSKFGGTTYDSLSEMTYMDMVISETLRLYPPVSRVDRTCTKQYQFPDLELKLKPKDSVAILIYGLHMDPQYYPRPTEFIPERFSAEEKKIRPAFVYLPFGEGPRNCIGLRFAMLSIKMALSHLLLNFELISNEKTKSDLKFRKTGVLLNTESGIWLDVKPLK